MSISEIVHDTPIGTLTLAASADGLTRVRFGTHTRGGRGTGPAADVVDRARTEIDEYLAGRRERFTVPVDLGRVHGEHRMILDALNPFPPMDVDAPDEPRPRADAAPWSHGEKGSPAGVGFGETTTYGALAARLGLIDDGPRRVGAAMARNPVLIVVPCHRVLGAGGRLVGYAGGIPAKQALLDLEASDRAGQTVLC